MGGEGRGLLNSVLWAVQDSGSERLAVEEAGAAARVMAFEESRRLRT